MKGKFITFEGMDASGKTTNIQMLADHLRDRGYKVITTREPGGWGVAGAELLRNAILQNKFERRAELLLFAAARVEHIEKLIRPQLELGKIVISDRFVDSTFAYQAYGRGLPVEEVEYMEKYACAGLEPDHTLFFDVPLEESMRRMAQREGNDHFDLEVEDFRQRIFDGYRRRFLEKGHRMFRIDALPAPEEVAVQVRNWANAHFENLK